MSAQNLWLLYLHDAAAAAAADLVPSLQLDVLRPVLVPTRPDAQLRHLGVLQHVGGQLSSRLQAVAVLPYHRLAVGCHIVLHHPQLDVLSQVAAHDLPPADDHLDRGQPQEKDAGETALNVMERGRRQEVMKGFMSYMFERKIKVRKRGIILQQEYELKKVT